MTVIREGKLELSFDETWTVVKWDDDVAFREGIGRLNGTLMDGDRTRDEGTKAVDIVGVREGILYLIELKDFRGHRIENKKRQIQDLPLEIGLKVRDTVAGLVGAALRGTDPSSALVAGLTSLRDQRQPRVVALIAEDAAPSGMNRDKAAAVASQRLQSLRGRLRWFTTKVWLDDPFSHGLSGLHVRSNVAES